MPEDIEHMVMQGFETDDESEETTRVEDDDIDDFDDSDPYDPGFDAMH
jgi:hypothetical protein